MSEALVELEDVARLDFDRLYIVFYYVKLLNSKIDW